MHVHLDELTLVDFLTRYVGVGKKFGDLVPEESMLNHIASEVQEVRDEPDDTKYEEWVDLVLLSTHGLLRALTENGDLNSERAIDLAQAAAVALLTKTAINETRTWVKPSSPDMPIEHDRSKD